MNTHELTINVTGRGLVYLSREKYELGDILVFAEIRYKIIGIEGFRYLTYPITISENKGYLLREIKLEEC